MTSQYQLTDGLSPDLVIEGRDLILSAQRVVEVTGEAQQSLAAQVGQALHVHLKQVGNGLLSSFMPTVSYMVK